MDWQTQAWAVFENLQRLQYPWWLSPSIMVVALLLLVALALVFDQYLRARALLAKHPDQARSFQDTLPLADEEAPRGISLEGEGRALVDRILPRRPGNFVLAVLAFVIGCWILGLLLTTNVRGYLESPEWQLQPLYLAAHFVTLRLFSNAFTRYFRAGAVHLDVAPATARRNMRLIKGPLGALVALALALPFCIYDYRTFFVAPDGAGTDGLGIAADRLLLGLWCIEWFLLTFVWVMLVGFLLLTRWTIGEHRFLAPIEVVLHAKQYRPFLQMSVQGATIVLLFCIVNAVYVWYTGGELSDYVGAVVTLVLLVVGFLPPWMLLRTKVNRAVDEEMSSLRRRVATALSRDTLSAMGTAPPQTPQDLQMRLDEVLVMLRISYLERLRRDLGHTEAVNIVVKLLAPVTTIVWYVLRYMKEGG